MRIAWMIGLLLILLPDQVSGQPVNDTSRSRWSGDVAYARAAGRNQLAAAVRVDRPLLPKMRGDIALTFSRDDVALGSRPASEPGGGALRASLAGVIAAVRADLSAGHARPYVGLASGLTRRFGPDRGDRQLRWTTSAVVGLRMALGTRVAARAELHLRLRDQRWRRTE